MASSSLRLFPLLLTRRRVRNINLRVRADGSVAASASPRVPAAYVDAFVTARADWVRTAQARAAARREREAAEAPALPPKAEALVYLAEQVGEFLEWRKREQELLEAANARLLLLLSQEVERLEAAETRH